MQYSLVGTETPFLLAQALLYEMKNQKSQMLNIVSIILNSGLLNQHNHFEIFHLDLLKNIILQTIPQAVNQNAKIKLTLLKQIAP